ncbi:MEKHLA domain-containing protein [Caballeronia insecticola]|uniref:MEKHLA domain protein n=1 Tax=Caballeronia insecticola TaxID=758793 RepID=R4X550_9BURK|nr:MEKHLA domain-containing protein [Caballeronia insecticola]BAN27907.1 MEKHLA domain protein [Caballeronia insecticola]
MQPTDLDFFTLLSESYARLLGTPLVPGEENTPAEAARWLYEDAPFGVLAHDTQADPVFVYGNLRAQRLFGYTWNELTALPSRLSAEAPERSERQAFLEEVTRAGYVTGYRGVRVRKSRERFWIERATVWQLFDRDGVYRGQAAMIPHVTDIT